MGFSDYEVQAMRKYAEPRILDKADRYIVDRFRNTAIMNLGYTELKKEHPDADIEITDTACLTEFGKKVYRRECIRRSPLRRFFHGIFNSV